ncbi:hypothetical protein L7F22_043088 [Adiantum nelumboides]|nr:hypothetical protein [Adiantum nelumboides]
MKTKQQLKDMEFQLLHAQQANVMMQEQNQDWTGNWRSNITLRITYAQEWINKVRTDLEDKVETFTQALVNEALVSHLGDLDNKSEDDENEEDDDDKEDEDNEEHAGTSKHQGPDDDDNDDDDHQGLPGTGPSSRGTSNEPPLPPPASQPQPPVSTKFKLAKELQLKEFLKADDMYGDMERLAMLYSGVMQVEMLLGHKPQYQCIQDVRNSIREGLSKIKVAKDVWDHKLQRILDFTQSSSTLAQRPMTEYQEKNIKNMIHVIKIFKRMLSQENDILINNFELMFELPTLLYAIRMEETELPRFYPVLYPPHTEPVDQMKYMQIVEQIKEWWENFEGLWNDWKEIINTTEQKKIAKELKAPVVDFRAGMLFWKRHMHVLVKHTNALLHQLNIEASKILEKDIENLATNEEIYREKSVILF